MSPCNAFRFFAVSATVVLSIVGGPVPGLINRDKKIVTRDLKQDLMQQGSITVEFKNDLKRPNDINSLTLNNVKNLYAAPLNSRLTKRNTSTGYDITIPSEEAVPLNISETTSEVRLETVTEVPSSSVKNFLKEIFVNTQTKEAKEEREYGSENSNVINNLQLEEPQKNGTDFSAYIDKIINANQTKDTNENEPSTVITLVTKRVSNSNQSMHLANEVLGSDAMKSHITEKSSEPIEMSSSTSSAIATTGKKYTIIERKRVITTTDESIATDTSTDNIEMNITTLYEAPPTTIYEKEIMVNSETTQGRTFLQDAITSDIPSLEKLKTDLLSYAKFSNKSNDESTTRLLSTGENDINTESSAPIMSTSESKYSSEFPNTVSSKRAGYLDLSAKAIDTITESVDILKPNGTEALQGPFDAETPDTQDETPEDKTENRMESQGQLAEDAIKEELLKEELLNDNEEIAKRHRDEQQQKAIDKSGTNVTLFNDTVVPLAHNSPDDNLSVKPISSDKLKSTVLYPVNPNYKPLKKIEVQPAKPFVRDPDDNSWRNESLSSLGIVFKPKNSSKPFTQVLKNKTETEWNNLPEKDRKSELPDLRERLEQIAQKRKSKKKKIDLFGNVFYTDYEENSSSSEENTTATPIEDSSFETGPTTDISLTTDITIVTPIQTTSLPSTNSDTQSTLGFTTPASPTLSKAQTTSALKKDANKFTTIKPSKSFNLFDYYESNDDDDIADYLNMAKIDIKKYTVPIQTTYTPFTSPPLTILYTTPVNHYTSERKGTIQYFPPRTTTRPRKHKQKGNVQHKINSFTESSKDVIPIFRKLPTAHYDSGMYYSNSPDTTGLKDDNVQDHRNLERNLYLTTPPLTTLPDQSFGALAADGEYNRANYGIKQYTNEAAQAEDKNRDLAGYTRPPQGVAENESFKTNTAKDNMKTNEEYDYETQFRKDVFDRFVANFNENSKRFKTDFPLLYNNSVVHAGPDYDDREVALSRAYLRRPFGNRRDYEPLSVPEPYDPNCDNVTVELSPAYELHYYVPEQEEKREVEERPATLALRYGL